MELLHATVVEWQGKGIMIMGPPGAGKSDLALRLIDAGGILVGDDYVNISKEKDRLIARPAENIAGLMEVRGVGLVHMAYKKQAGLDLVLDLKAERSAIERLPEAAYFERLGVRLPRLEFYAFEVSAVAKLRCAIDFFNL
ncbi:HPr kinase/phosphorylase [Luteithermobacter gelatinilyticus]|uniref:HPr kinase/phosphorylase n=1 Tax=Luteithermobacter gelatinilyticus TaxID=2582913 RepID=UPI00110697A0|nr:HPr kinase/phosphatase C-terminal domain-containing protein [Luteithermobacter gelatinilyticus]|tara:strand:- start:4106 stop:4525 length:420 start_codon:yes stop_codon:yes gene_type:complete